MSEISSVFNETRVTPAGIELFKDLACDTSKLKDFIRSPGAARVLGALYDTSEEGKRLAIDILATDHVIGHIVHKEQGASNVIMEMIEKSDLDDQIKILSARGAIGMLVSPSLDFYVPGSDPAKKITEVLEAAQPSDQVKMLSDLEVICTLTHYNLSSCDTVISIIKKADPVDQIRLLTYRGEENNNFPKGHWLRKDGQPILDAARLTLSGVAEPTPGNS